MTFTYAASVSGLSPDTAKSSIEEHFSATEASYDESSECWLLYFSSDEAYRKSLSLTTFSDEQEITVSVAPTSTYSNFALASISSSDPFHFTLSSTDVLNTLFTTEKLSDQTLLYNDLSLNVHRIVLATQSSYFHNCFITGFSDQKETVYDLSSVSVDTDVFHSFIKLLYGYPLVLTSSNCYQFFRCARYFLVEPFLNHTLSLLKANMTSSEWVGHLLVQAQDRDDLQIFNVLNNCPNSETTSSSITKIMSRVDDAPPVMSLLPETFSLLIPSSCYSQILSEWLSKCLVVSALEDDESWSVEIVKASLRDLNHELLSADFFIRLY
ncbi:hypothetical protein GEMRC1_011856 [Eukaryota sp. GEM-RC1]